MKARASHGALAAERQQEALEQRFINRVPRDWQLEACATLASGVAPRPIPGRFSAWVEQQRAAALEQIKEVSAIVVVRACQAAQREQRGTIGTALFYGAARPLAILAQVSAADLPLLSIGPARPWRAVLKEAAALRPTELWEERTGWRSLGVRRDKRPPRDALGWIRDAKGRRVG